jgi:hypothetical protein
MSFIQFIVRQRKGSWSITSGDLDQSFEDCAAAMKAAVDLANKSGKDGKPALVNVEGRKGEFRTAWTYGTDPYPPSKADIAKVAPSS